MQYATAADLADGLARFARARHGVAATPGYRVAYAEQGEPGAPTVVLVHGLSDQAASFALLTARLTRAGFRTVALELADGKGDGAKLGNYRHSDHARDLIALFDHLKLDRPHLFASSYGSTVALRALLDFPARVAKCVLQGGFARRPLNRAEIALARVARFLPGRMAHLPGRPKAMAQIDGPQFAHAAPKIYEFMLKCSGRSPLRAVAQRALVLATLDLRPRLNEIATPTLLIGGDADPIVPRHCEAELERGLLNARRVELPGGHYPQYVLPTPTAEAMVDFLTQPAPGVEQIAAPASWR